MMLRAVLMLWCLGLPASAQSLPALHDVTGVDGSAAPPSGLSGCCTLNP